MRGVAVIVALLLWAGTAYAKPAKRGGGGHKSGGSGGKPAAASSSSGRTSTGTTTNATTSTTTSTSTSTSGAGETAVVAAPVGGGKSVKTKTYTFGAMDVEGKLKTPQLLYFLNRVKLELDMSAPDKRSFMKELAQSADDRNL